MKKSKLIALWALTLITGMVVGGTCVRLYMGDGRAAHACACNAHKGMESLDIAQLENASLAAGLQEVADNVLKSSAEIPSQLVKTAWPEGMVLASESKPTDEKPAGVVLSDGQNTVVLNAQKPVQRAADGTSITMIEAPVTVKRIKTLAQYKAFKQVARGSYPTVDFAKEEVIALESASNLPDKVFEIVQIAPEGKNLKVTYRVNVFGLDQKTNTHSVQKIKKNSSPVVLEQVL